METRAVISRELINWAASAGENEETSEKKKREGVSKAKIGGVIQTLPFLNITEAILYLLWQLCAL